MTTSVYRQFTDEQLDAEIVRLELAMAWIPPEGALAAAFARTFCDELDEARREADRRGRI